MLDTFITCLVRVVISLCFAIPGFILCKIKKASANHLSTMSTILVYVCGPAMVISSFYNASISQNARSIAAGTDAVSDRIAMGLQMTYFAIATLILQAVFMFTLYFILKRKYEDAKYRIFTCGSVLGNVGFFGLPLVQALVDNPVAQAYSSIYVLTMNVLVFTVGVFCLTNDKKYMSIKTALINPTTIAMVLGIPAFIFAPYLDGSVFGGVFMEQLWDGLTLLGKMTTPMCMLILGIRLAAVDFKKIWTRPFIYLICAMKMIVFPIFCFFVVYFIPFLDNDFKKSLLIISSVPCASVILNLAEMHHSEEELAANCVLVSTLLCFITIPFVTLLANLL